MNKFKEGEIYNYGEIYEITLNNEAYKEKEYGIEGKIGGKFLMIVAENKVVSFVLHFIDKLGYNYKCIYSDF